MKKALASPFISRLLRNYIYVRITVRTASLCACIYTYLYIRITDTVNCKEGPREEARANAAIRLRHCAWQRMTHWVTPAKRWAFVHSPAPIGHVTLTHSLSLYFLSYRRSCVALAVERTCNTHCIYTVLPVPGVARRGYSQYALRRCRVERSPASSRDEPTGVSTIVVSRWCACVVWLYIYIYIYI